MKNEILSANTLLKNRGITILDAARLICNVLDAMPENSVLTPLQFCSKVIETGKQHIRIAEMSIANVFALYMETKLHLRLESFSDIRYLGNRLLKSNPELVAQNFYEISLSE